MASYQVGPEVLPGRVGVVPLTDHVDHGMAATLSWQGSHGNRRSVTASSWRADERRYRTAPPQLRTKGNSGIIKGGCAERKLLYQLKPRMQHLKAGQRFSVLLIRYRHIVYCENVVR